MGSLGGMSPSGSIALGIVVGLISTSVQSLGLTLQRKSHILEDEKGPYDVRRPPYRRRRWQLGMGMFIISNILGSTVQISTLPLPVLSTLQASGLVFNSICATLILGEPFTRWSLWGTLLVCAGAVLIAIFGAIPSPTHNLSELLDLLARRSFVVWMALQAVLVIAICVAVDGANHVLKLSQNPRFRLLRGLAFGCVSGILSAHSLLVAKSAVELIIKTLVDGKNQFVHWQAWVIVLALITLALTQLYYLHRGLKLVSTSVLYPLVFCIYNIIAILDGLIYFDQMEQISPLYGCLIALGTVILLSGVLALSWRLSDEQHPPGVGQSTLAPGLGLVEDTDGEEEEEELLLGNTGVEDDVLPTTRQYNTFDNAQDETIRRPRPEPLPLASSHATTKKRTSFMQPPKWQERREIWGELDDDDIPYSPLNGPNRLRSKTLPTHEFSRHQHRRGLSTGDALPNPFRSETDMHTGRAGSASDRPPGSSKSDFRLRRKSTGFPGFTARRVSRRKSVGGGGAGALHGAIDGLSRWWRSRGLGGQGGELSLPASATTLPEYRDDDVAVSSPVALGYQDEPSPRPQPPASGPEPQVQRDGSNTTHDAPPPPPPVTGQRREDDSPV